MSIESPRMEYAPSLLLDTLSFTAQAQRQRVRPQVVRQRSRQEEEQRRKQAEPAPKPEPRPDTKKQEPARKSPEPEKARKQERDEAQKQRAQEARTERQRVREERLKQKQAEREATQEKERERLRAQQQKETEAQKERERLQQEEKNRQKEREKQREESGKFINVTVPCYCNNHLWAIYEKHSDGGQTRVKLNCTVGSKAVLILQNEGGSSAPCDVSIAPGGGAYTMGTVRIIVNGSDLSDPFSMRGSGGRISITCGTCGRVDKFHTKQNIKAPQDGTTSTKIECVCGTKYRMSLTDKGIGQW